MYLAPSNLPEAGTPDIEITEKLFIMQKRGWIAVLSLVLSIVYFGCTPEDGHRGVLKDNEGNEYKTIVIGDQVWMGENLRSKKYSDGGEIADIRMYNDDETLADVYGLLYTYDAATRGGTDKKGRIQGACPKRWHMPTDDEWKALEMHLGLSAADADLMAWRGTIEGGMLKEAGTEHWEAPNAEATNTTGFSALPGGSYNVGVGFTGLKKTAYFWSVSESTATEVWSRVLQHSTGHIGRYPSGKDLGFCIRCVKD
jgi:uncharacterized protein (TIGR02145 family)